MRSLSVYMRAAGALAAGFVSLSSAVAGDGFLVMDMVHHNPGDTPFESKFLDPAFLSEIGSQAKVVNDFKAPQCACTFDELDPEIFPAGSDGRKWVDAFAAECEAKAAACHREGLKCYYFMDIFVLPRTLMKKYAAEICDADGKVSFTRPKTWEIHRLMLREMLRRVPSIDGYVIRTGEMYSHNVPYHGGNTPVNFKKGQDLFVDTHAKLINLLREELCVKGGKKVFYRTWDFRRFHKRPDLYLAITGRVEPHENLYFSIKHTSEDYLRYTTFNPTLGLGKHKQIVEVQCQREYEGKGAYPNYVVKGALEGFEENRLVKGLKGIVDLSKWPLFAGVWTWSRGGGWEGPYLKNELWCEMNADVMTEWALHPEAGEEKAFEKFMDRKGVAPESRAAFRRIALLSADAVVRGMGNLPPESVKACWTRDHFIGDYGWLKDDYERLVTNGLVEAALKNKRKAVQLWEEIARLAETVKMADKADEHYVRTSAQYGLRLYRIYEAGWTVTLHGYRGDRTGVYDKAAIADAICRYDEAWKDYRRLPSEAADCATLFDGHYANYHISQDHNSIDPAPGMDAEVDKYRRFAAETPWSSKEFFGEQTVFPMKEYDLTNGVRAVMIRGSAFHGEETRVFAYYGLPKGASAARKAPAMVLVHGGLGTAHEEWVRLWNSRGYAAIAMDTCGALPIKGSKNTCDLKNGLGWLRHAYAGPEGWGRYDRVFKDDPEDQWTFHAVGAVIRAHSFLRSLPEVDAARIGLTGISWGGYLTSIVASVDDRFAFAAPVYGTGRYDLCTLHANATARTDAKTAAEWLRLWDPANWMRRAKCPFLFVDSNVDFAYPLAQVVAASELLQTQVTYCVLPGYGHSQGEGARPEEIRAFADHLLRGGADVVRFGPSALAGGRLVTSFDAKGRKLAKVELVVTADAQAKWVEKKWERRTLTVGADGKVAAELPRNFVCAFVNAVTDDGLVFSCKPVFPEPPPAQAADRTSADFTVVAGRIRKELHGSGLGGQLTGPQSAMIDDLKELHLDGARTHDWALFNAGQRMVDTHFIFPLLHADADDPKNYFFGPTDEVLDQTIERLGMNVFYRMGTSIESVNARRKLNTWMGVTGEMRDDVVAQPGYYNSVEPADYVQYAKALEHIIAHYTEGWANGRKWGDRMQYWELWNEANDFPGGSWIIRSLDTDREKNDAAFNEFFVTVLKRLKARFPHLKFGGPATCTYDERFLRNLLRHCKESGYTPDFLSWHGYSDDPDLMLCRPEKARKLCDEFGFTKTELIINEWHYIPNGRVWLNLGKQGPEYAKIIDPATDGLTSAESGVYILQVLSGLQTTCLDRNYYYGSGQSYGCVWGIRNADGTLNKTYYALKAFGAFAGDCENFVQAESRKGAARAFGAWTKDGKKAKLLVTHYRGKNARVEVAVKGLDGLKLSKVQLLDSTHDLSEVPVGTVERTGDRLAFAKTDRYSQAWLLTFSREDDR